MGDSSTGMEGTSLEHLADLASPSQPANAGLPVIDSVSNYEKLKRIGEGTYGVVCESVHTGCQAAHAPQRKLALK